MEVTIEQTTGFQVHIFLFYIKKTILNYLYILEILRAKSSGIAKKARFEKEYTVVPYQKEKDLIPLVEHGFMGFGAKRDTGEWTVVWMDKYPLDCNDF